MTDPRWQTLLDETRGVHARIQALSDFCPFPESLDTRAITPRHDPLCDAMQTAHELPGQGFESFRDALIAAAPLGQWRDTYRDTPIGDELHRHFGCYEVVGRDAPFVTEAMRGFVIYQTAGYHYPMHSHPAEEVYIVIAGEGEFHLEGQPSRTLRPGDTIFHPSGAPHALTTHGSPIMAYVLWRGDLMTKPVFTET